MTKKRQALKFCYHGQSADQSFNFLPQRKPGLFLIRRCHMNGIFLFAVCILFLFLMEDFIPGAQASATRGNNPNISSTLTNKSKSLSLTSHKKINHPKTNGSSTKGSKPTKPLGKTKSTAKTTPKIVTEDVATETPANFSVHDNDAPDPTEKPNPKADTESEADIQSPLIIPPVGDKKSMGNNATRCEEHKNSGMSNIIDWLDHDGLIAELEDVSFRNTFSSQQINSSNLIFGCAPKLDSTDCDRNICYNLRYRTADGTCNNFENPFFGASATPYIRSKKPVYDDGIQALTASMIPTRPSSRDVSRILLSSPEFVISARLNTLLMQFGQFIVHDITRTSLLPTERCVGCTSIVGQCAPIIADQFDSKFGCANPPCCIAFARASPVCGTGATTAKVLLNENTAFLDGSMIYGSSIADHFRLRQGASLRTTAFDGGTFLPHDTRHCKDVTKNCDPLFETGDDRVTIFAGLVNLHTLFLREHNRIAAILQLINPAWSADRVFQETRKIVGAQIQVITYKEWLPNVLGSVFDDAIGPYKEYDDSVDASISSEFSHAAMRFGHGMIQDSFNRMDEFGRSIRAGSMKFEDGIFRPERIFEGGVDPLIRGMMLMPLKKPQKVVESVTEKIFIDLAATNLQRGRDAGLPSYNDWRDNCGMKKAKTFDDLSDEISDKNTRALLQAIYGTPDAMDLYAATLLEDPVEGGLTGPTPACIIGDQFRRIRNGDRFWYQNPAIFTSDQLEELEDATFSRILCDSGDNFRSAPPKAFELAINSNTFVSCASIPSIDLNKWKE